MKYIILASLILLSSCCELKECTSTCTILGHECGADRNGHMSYYTIIDCDSVKVDVRGLEHYTDTVGSKMNYTTCTCE